MSNITNLSFWRSIKEMRDNADALADMGGGFPGCPECPPGRGEDEFRNVGKEHWGFCNRHKTCWCIGSNLLSSWMHETEADWNRARAKLACYRDVSPPLPDITGLVGVKMSLHSADEFEDLEALAEQRTLTKLYAGLKDLIKFAEQRGDDELRDLANRAGELIHDRYWTLTDNVLGVTCESTEEQ